MTKPDIPQKSPCGVRVEPGVYWWCSCGKSQKQPFCDGSHKDTDFSPLKITVLERDFLVLCGCKQTADAPFCDGSHNNL